MKAIASTGFRRKLGKLREKLRSGPRLFPAIKPFSHHHLRVAGDHELYVEQCGNRHGIPVVFLHGGPGAGCNAFNRRFFDPARYHIILFDQRGAGRSSPHSSLENNTTQDLVSDMEEIRKHLGISQWLLFGGSWGSTLALVYAEAYPQHVLGIVVRGIFLCRSQDIDWFYREGAGRLLPEYWEEFCAAIPQQERSDLIAAYHRRLISEDSSERQRAAIAWSTWEGRASTLVPSPSQLSYFSDPEVALSMARIECHYFRNLGFLEENQILREAHRLKGIPGRIVHGRYDVVCPVENAWELHRAWEESELQIIPKAGHSAAEVGISSALVAATNQFAKIL